jgi:hypothetical protein
MADRLSSVPFRLEQADPASPVRETLTHDTVLSLAIDWRGRELERYGFAASLLDPASCADVHFHDYTML